MDLYTLDFETFYDQTYSLSKITTEAYVRDDRFEAILLGIKRNDEPTIMLRGAERIMKGLDKLRATLEKSAILCHHAQFDGFILNHHYSIRPKVWFDTLSMARALNGAGVRNSLSALAERYGRGQKGTEVISAKGKHHIDFSKDELERYAIYCANDVDLTYTLFMEDFLPNYPRQELRLIDKVIRTFTEPMLRLDSPHLDEYVKAMRGRKAQLILESGVTREDLMSNEKFATRLLGLGVVPPKKISPTTGKPTYAFAKTDDGMAALAEYPDEAVQALVAARLGNKSTINETRAVRMSNMGDRGAAPIYLNYSGASQTHRMSGGDSMNWQNLSKTKAPKAECVGDLIVTPEGIGNVVDEITRPSEQSDQDVLWVTVGGDYFKADDCHTFGLRDAVYAPPGYVLVVVDSANIEARVLDTIAGQHDAVRRYRDKQDPYLHLAGQIYNREITKADYQERQLGKVAKLGLGYGMGASKFQDTAINWGVDISGTLAQHTVNIYRGTHKKVTDFWSRCENALPHVGREGAHQIDSSGLLCTSKEGILLPSGLQIRYPELHKDSTGWSYNTGRFRTKIYSGKIAENCVQALARIIVTDQWLQIEKAGYHVAHFVHDELVLCVRQEEAQEALEYALEVMRASPSWWPEVPLDAAGDIAVIYGMAK